MKLLNLGDESKEKFKAPLSYEGSVDGLKNPHQASFEKIDTVKYPSSNRIKESDENLLLSARLDESSLLNRVDILENNSNIFDDDFSLEVEETFEETQRNLFSTQGIKEKAYDNFLRVKQLN